MNGEISFKISDLYCDESKTPLFGQLYVIDPSKAIAYRDQHLRNKPYNVEIKESVLQIIDFIIREHHPFANVYKSTDEIFQKEIQKRQKSGDNDIPSFRVIDII